MLSTQCLLQDAKNKFSKLVMTFLKYRKMLGVRSPAFTDFLLSIPVNYSTSSKEEFRRLNVKPRDIL